MVRGDKVKPNIDEGLTVHEYTLQLDNEAVLSFVDDKRIVGIGRRSDCTIQLTNRILNRPCSQGRLVKHCIIRIIGKDEASIVRCNRLLERLLPDYIYRKEYNRRAPLTIYTKEFLPDNSEVYYMPMRTGGFRNNYGDVPLKSPHNVSVMRPLGRTPWKITADERMGNYDPHRLLNILAYYKPSMGAPFGHAPTTGNNFVPEDMPLAMPIDNEESESSDSESSSESDDEHEDEEDDDDDDDYDEDSESDLSGFSSSTKAERKRAKKERKDKRKQEKASKMKKSGGSSKTKSKVGKAKSGARSLASSPAGPIDKLSQNGEYGKLFNIKSSSMMTQKMLEHLPKGLNDPLVILVEGNDIMMAGSAAVKMNPTSSGNGGMEVDVCAAKFKIRIEGDKEGHLMFPNSTSSAVKPVGRPGSSASEVRVML